MIALDVRVYWLANTLATQSKATIKIIKARTALEQN